MQHTEIFIAIKNENFQKNYFYIFLIFAQNIDCGYMFRGSSNGYPQSMFWSKKKKKKNRYTPAYPSFGIYKTGV